MKLFLYVLLLFIGMAFSLFAQNADSSLAGSVPGSTFDFNPAQEMNSFNISPLDILFSKVGGSYEHLFAPRHGFLIEGSHAFGKGYDITAGYRYHFFSEKNESGLISHFWGFFIHKGKNSNTYEDPDTKKKYELDVDLLTVGIHWGRRTTLGGSFYYTWRIGYGYPLVLDFNWVNGKPGNSNTIEGLTKIFSGIDGELSVGIVF